MSEITLICVTEPVSLVCASSGVQGPQGIQGEPCSDTSTWVADETELLAVIDGITDGCAQITIAQEIPIIADLTIPESVNLKFLRCGMLSPESGVTLTVNSTIDAGLWQIFGGDGAVTGAPVVPCVYPEWFGGSLDKAVAFVESSQATIHLSSLTTAVDDIVLPETITLSVAQGGMVDIAEGKALTINGSLEAGLYQIFGGAGTPIAGGNIHEAYPEWFGADGDGVTDDTTALQAAAAFCYSPNPDNSIKLCAPKKSYVVTSTVILRCNGDMRLAKILADGTFTPTVQIGSTEANTFRLNLALPSVKNITKTGLGWGVGQVPLAGAVGVSCVNLVESDISVAVISGFSVGLKITSQNTKGNSYNTYHLGTLKDNQINLQIKPADATGWANENLFLSGRLAFSSSENDNTGTRQVSIEYYDVSGHPPNNNVFIKTSLETEFAEYKVYLWGMYNQFNYCRWEGAAPNLAIYSHTSAEETQDNIISGGYSAHSVVTNVVKLGLGGRYNNLFATGRRVLCSMDSMDGVNAGLRIVPSNNSISSYVDDASNLGHPSYRFDNIYATNATIQTSDEREKTDIRTLSDSEKVVAERIKGMMKAFRFKKAVEKKGSDARIHFGAVAQEIAQAFRDEGLDPERYALFCYDEWEGDDETPAGNRYGIRYSELLAFVIGAM